MAITAFSIEAAAELDVEQWLTLNGYMARNDPNLDDVPPALRAKALADILCSGCQVRGAALVGAGRQKGVGRNVSQGHFRFGASGSTNPHHPLCDLYDDKERRNTDYLVNFASDKSAMTRVIRDLVCRGIRARRFTQADIRDMRLWFLQQRVAHAVKLDIEPELLRWCVDMDSTRLLDEVPFRPEHGQMPGFDWHRAAKNEWRRRNAALFGQRRQYLYFSDETISRALKLIESKGDATVLDPLPLREKYEAVTRMADFAAMYVARVACTPLHPSTLRAHKHLKPRAAHALLALGALLLFKNDWDLGQASADFAMLAALPSAADGKEGNVMGLNPFHDYPAWEIIHEARKVAAQRIDARPVPEQIAEIEASMRAAYVHWAS
jgi:hypothetical protein